MKTLLAADSQVRHGHRCRMQGRVASRMRSRHPAAFNSLRDIAVARCKGSCPVPCGHEEAPKSLIYLGAWSLLAPCGAVNGGPGSLTLWLGSRMNASFHVLASVELPGKLPGQCAACPPCCRHFGSSVSRCAFSARQARSACGSIPASRAVALSLRACSARALACVRPCRRAFDTARFSSLATGMAGQ
jgi:hypothetical protein